MSVSSRIADMRDTLEKLCKMLDDINMEIAEDLGAGDIESAFERLRKYREFSMKAVTIDCDIAFLELVDRSDKHSRVLRSKYK
jgi:hypothetical protein